MHNHFPLLLAAGSFLLSAALTRLWTEDNVTFEGRHYHCQGITIDPKPTAKPRPHIWIANNPPPGDQEQIRRTSPNAIELGLAVACGLVPVPESATL